MKGRGSKLVLLAASLVSGTAGLVHQVLWVRQLTLVLGGTVVAVSAVLAAFMAGLGLGSFLAGRFVDRLSDRGLARLYAALEAGVAVLAPALAPLAWALAPAAPLPRLAVCGLLVLLPATLMGATLPALTALWSPAAARVAGAAGRIYASNTAGAMIGSLGSVVLLLPHLGVFRSLLAGAALNLVAGALVLARRPPAEEPAPAEAPPARAARPSRKRAGPPAPEGERLPTPAALLLLALSGLAALAGEVAWTRVLILLIGPTPFAFAFVLTSVIAGIALGSALASARADRWRRPASALAAVQLVAAASSLVVVRLLGSAPLVVAEVVREHADRMGRLLGLQFAGVFLLLLVPCVCFGATLPFALRAMAGRQPAGRTLAGAYASNTAGAIAGALLGGLVALPALGMRGTLLAAAAVSAAAGALALPWIRGGTGRAAAAAAVLALAAGGPRLAGGWDPELLAGGAYKYAAYAPSGRLESTLRAGQLVYYREGRAATISVKRLGGHLSLAVDGKVDATTSTDMLTQRMLAHLPLLLHPAPRAVGVIGLGSGVTVGSALAHGVESVEAVEISPEVVEAAALFRHANRDALSDRRLRVVVADGRHHLLMASPRYDVLISEPSNPWMAGVAPLFTRDFFALARSRLAPGGLMCQWIHIYNMDPRDLRTVVGSFTDVFPGAALFLVNDGDALLLGGPGALPAPDGPALARRMTAEPVRQDLAEVGVRSPFGLASVFALGPPALAAWAAGAPRHTDDRPRLEFSAPRWIHADTSAANRRLMLEAARLAPTPEPFASLLAGSPPLGLAERAAMLEQAGSTRWALETYAQAAAQDPTLLPALEGLVRTSLALGRPAEAEGDLRRLAERGAAAPLVALALLEHNRERPAEALALLQRAIERDPRSRRALLLGAEIQLGGGNLEAAEGLARSALAASSSDAEAEAVLAAVDLERGRLEEALARAQSLLRRDPRATRALEVAALAHARRGDDRLAREAFAALVQAEPSGWSHLNNYGLFELERGEARAAARLFQQAVDVHPGNVPGWRGLAAAARALGDRELQARAERALAALAR